MNECLSIYYYYLNCIISSNVVSIVNRGGMEELTLLKQQGLRTAKWIQK